MKQVNVIPKQKPGKPQPTFFEVPVPYLQGELSYDDLTSEGKKLCSDLVGRINDVINDELKYSELSSEENKHAIKLALQSALAYYGQHSVEFKQWKFLINVTDNSIFTDEYDTLTDLQTNIRNLWHKANAKLVIE